MEVQRDTGVADGSLGLVEAAHRGVHPDHRQPPGCLAALRERGEHRRLLASRADAHRQQGGRVPSGELIGEQRAADATGQSEHRQVFGHQVEQLDLRSLETA